MDKQAKQPQWVVTIKKPEGYVSNHLVEHDRLRDFLEKSAMVLLPSETLSFALALEA